MKIVTLHQPYASLVALKLKCHETRHWSTSYRGPLLIHAAKKPMSDKDGSISTIAMALYKSCPTKSPEQWMHEICSFRLGCIVAISDLIDCRMMAEKYNTLTENLYAYINEQTELEKAVGDWQVGRYALRLENVRHLPSPIPFKSRQGKLLDAPEEIIAQVHQQIK